MEYSNVWIGAWIIITATIGIFAVIYNITYESKKEKVIARILALLFAVFIGIFVFGTHKMSNSTLIWTKTANENLVSLNDNNMTNGKFYARRGYINEDLWYQYMVDVGGGGYVANKVPSNGTTVYHTTDNPRCEWYRVSQKWWIFEQWKTCWKLYVPEGTIGTDFSIDLQ